MNIEHLKLFVRIAATSNISQAGKELGLSAATSSSHINKLEDKLGVKLIYRTTRQVSLTEEGQSFLPHAEQVLESIETARAAVGAGERKARGTLRVTSSASFGRLHLIPGIADFLAQFPDLMVDLRLSDSIVDMVEGGFDIAIRNAPLNDSSLIASRLAKDKRIIVAAPEYIAKYGKPESPEQLKHHACINIGDIESWVFNTPEGIKRFKVTGPLKIDNGEAARDACVQGIGLTLTSKWCVYNNLKKGELVEVLQDHPLISATEIWAVYPSSRLLAPKVRAFIDYYKAYFGDSPYWDT